MTGRKPILIVRLFVFGAVLYGAGITNAQSTDHISVMDSKVKVDMDRTMHVQESFEIVNDTGFFDSGLHRLLRIKPAGPQRAKPGSFEVIAAKIDGHNAVLQKTEKGDMLDVGIVPETGTLSKGGHVIELNYTAKYQFLIFDNFEDF